MGYNWSNNDGGKYVPIQTRLINVGAYAEYAKDSDWITKEHFDKELEDIKKVLVPVNNQISGINQDLMKNQIERDLRQHFDYTKEDLMNIID